MHWVDMDTGSTTGTNNNHRDKYLKLELKLETEPPVILQYSVTDLSNAY